MTTEATELARAGEDAIEALYASMSDETVATAGDALAAAIRASSDAGALEALLDRPYVAELLANEMGSLGLWPAIIDAMVSLADAFPNGADAARVLGWARWVCSTSPADLVRPAGERRGATFG